MNENSLEFGWSQLAELVALIQQLNMRGIPYTLRKDAHAIEITITRGY